MSTVGIYRIIEVEAEVEVEIKEVKVGSKHGGGVKRMRVELGDEMRWEFKEIEIEVEVEIE